MIRNIRVDDAVYAGAKEWDKLLKEKGMVAAEAFVVARKMTIALTDEVKRAEHKWILSAYENGIPLKVISSSLGLDKDFVDETIFRHLKPDYFKKEDKKDFALGYMRWSYFMYKMKFFGMERKMRQSITLGERQRLRQSVVSMVKEKIEELIRQNIICLYKKKVPVSTIARTLGKTPVEVEEIILGEHSATTHKKQKAKNKSKREYEYRNAYVSDAVECGRTKGLEEGITQGIILGLEEGIIRGHDEQNRQMVIRCYKNKIPVSTIALSIGKTQAEIKEIIRSELGPDACQE